LRAGATFARAGGKRFGRLPAHFRFSPNHGNAHLLVFPQFRTQNRITLLLELL
jgi:hypothetical protein